MRENRPYGSEGGESGKPDFPPPIVMSPLRGFSHNSPQMFVDVKNPTESDNPSIRFRSSSRRFAEVHRTSSRTGL